LYTGTYTTTFAGTNGFLSFGGGGNDNTPTPIPTIGDLDNYIGCFWADRYIQNATQGVWVETFGSAPNHYTVITFRTAYFADINATPNLFQMILYEGSNQIKCQYADMSGSINGDGRHATIGVENKWGDGGVQYFFGPDGYSVWTGEGRLSASRPKVAAHNQNRTRFGVHAHAPRPDVQRAVAH
jgi:hypothetical protein